MALDTQRKQVAHLLRRAGLGASPVELEHYAPLGVMGTVDGLLNYHKTKEEYPLDVWELRNDNGQLNPPAVGMWWTYRMLTTNRPLEQKMTLFWHDHFACSAEKVKGGPLMHQHLELLRENALANFDTILEETAKDVTMLVFLDGATNFNDRPNENFAREVMELYTMGIGNYNENDIAEAARAFTGWSVKRPNAIEKSLNERKLPAFFNRVGKHDRGQKTVLGQSGNFSGEDVLGLLVKRPETAHYICTKLWEWFAYPDPEPALVQRLTQRFTKANYSVRVLLQEIFTSTEFYSDQAERALYKSPVDFTIAALRALNVTQLIDIAEADTKNRTTRQQVLGGVRGIFGAMTNMGMQLLFPPTVAGWDGGADWVNSATMIERIKFADIFKPGGRMLPAQMLLGDEKYDSVMQAVQRAEYVYDVELTQMQREAIARSAEAKLKDGGLNPRARQEVVHEITRLVFATPQFQMC